MSKVIGEVVPTPGEEMPFAAVIGTPEKEWTRIPVSSEAQGEAYILDILTKLESFAIEEGDKKRNA